MRDIYALGSPGVHQVAELADRDRARGRGPTQQLPALFGRRRPGEHGVDRRSQVGDGGVDLVADRSMRSGSNVAVEFSYARGSG